MGNHKLQFVCGWALLSSFRLPWLDLLRAPLVALNPNLWAPIVQTVDSAIHQINHYPVDKYLGNQLRYPVDSDLSVA